MRHAAGFHTDPMKTSDRPAPSYAHGPGRSRCSARRSARTCAAPSSASATARRSSSATRATARPTASCGARSTAPRAALLARGVEKGDRVGIWAPNRYEWVVHPVRDRPHRRDPRHDQPGLQGGRAASTRSTRPASACWSWPRGFREADYVAMLAEVRGRCPALRETIVLDDDWDAFLADGADASPTPSWPRARRRCSSTTRSTSSTRRARPGSPKGATLSHHNILNNALLHRRGRWRYTEHDRVCVPVPFYHCFGMVLGNLACVTHGACMVVPGEAFDAAGGARGGRRPSAARRSTACRRCSSPSSTIRASTSSTCRACAPG